MDTKNLKTKMEMIEREYIGWITGKKTYHLPVTQRVAGSSPVTPAIAFSKIITDWSLYAQKYSVIFQATLIA